MKFDRLMEQLVGVFAILVLTVGTMIVLAPFVTTLLWGAILAYSSWHPFKRLAAALGGRPALATVLIVALILVCLLVPMFFAGVAFSTRVPEWVAIVQDRLASGLPPLPEWMEKIPLVGARLNAAWDGLATRNPEVIARLQEMAKPMFRTALGVALSLLQGLGLLLLSILFTAVFYLSGDSAGAGLRAGMRRIAGARAEALLALVGGTVKGVVFGILGTSLVQAVLCAAGYWIAGLPSPALLGLLTFFLAIIPGGPLLIVVPGAIWLVQTGASGWAIFLVVWTFIVAIGVDNVLKPILIGRSSHVPLILIMLGVFGGAAAFGLLGVFVGPTLLAVTHAVLHDWIDAKADDEVAAAADDGTAAMAASRELERLSQQQEEAS